MEIECFQLLVPYCGKAFVNHGLASRIVDELAVHVIQIAMARQSPAPVRLIAKPHSVQNHRHSTFVSRLGISHLSLQLFHTYGIIKLICGGSLYLMAYGCDISQFHAEWVSVKPLPRGGVFLERGIRTTQPHDSLTITMLRYKPCANHITPETPISQTVQPHKVVHCTLRVHETLINVHQHICRTFICQACHGIGMVGESIMVWLVRRMGSPHNILEQPELSHIGHENRIRLFAFVPQTWRQDSGKNTVYGIRPVHLVGNVDTRGILCNITITPNVDNSMRSQLVLQTGSDMSSRQR